MASSRFMGAAGIRSEAGQGVHADANRRVQTHPTSLPADATEVDYPTNAAPSNGSTRSASGSETTFVHRPAQNTPRPPTLRSHERSLADTEALLQASPRRAASYERTKRLIDLTVAGLLFVMTLPLMLIIAALIRLDSPGPALFRQARLGRNVREFEFIKFRTMYVDSRERFPEMYAYQFDEGEARDHQFKTAHDPRLTRVGRWIRRTSLDELPNFISVLKGDMSMVGPRPEIPEMLPYYRPEEICKFSVLPGVSGLAQVSGRNMLMWAQTNAHDVEYVHRRSLRLDLAIMVRTVTAVVGMVGAL